MHKVASLSDSLWFERMCAKSLGPKMPNDLTMRLYQPDDSHARQRVILVTTVDQDGFPRHLMLSHYEVVARDNSNLLMLIYSSSKSAQNLDRAGRASLLFLDEEMSYYVRVTCRRANETLEEAPQETLFKAKVTDVLEDKYPTTQITSGIRFSGFDPGMTEESRRKVFEKLVNLALSESGS